MQQGPRQLQQLLLARMAARVRQQQLLQLLLVIGLLLRLATLLVGMGRG
jgi:hypothetical protein